MVGVRAGSRSVEGAVALDEQRIAERAEERHLAEAHVAAVGFAPAVHGRVEHEVHDRPTPTCGETHRR